jgi:hypothetical protein
VEVEVAWRDQQGEPRLIGGRLEMPIGEYTSGSRAGVDRIAGRPRDGRTAMKTDLCPIDKGGGGW